MKGRGVLWNEKTGTAVLCHRDNIPSQLLLLVGPWANAFTSLCLTSRLCKMGLAIITVSWDCCEKANEIAYLITKALLEGPKFCQAQC